MLCNKSFRKSAKGFLQSLDRGTNKIKKRIFFRTLHHSSLLLPSVMEFYYHPFCFLGHPSVLWPTKIISCLQTLSIKTKGKLVIFSVKIKFMTELENSTFLDWNRLLCNPQIKHNKISKKLYFLSHWYMFSDDQTKYSEVFIKILSNPLRRSRTPP